LTVESELLRDNPLGDSAVRGMYVYLPPGYTSDADVRYPSIYLLQGFGGHVEEWLLSNDGGQTLIERVDELIVSGQCRPTLLAFVDAWTSRGGSQFLNSTSTGRYFDYVCDEVIPFVDANYATAPAREHRGVSGKSSGGFGALILSMLRADLFGALASHAGDVLFDCCYQPLFPMAARLLRDQFGGSWERFERRIDEPDFSWRECPALFAAYGTACAYTPDPERPGRALIPFDAAGRPVDEVWERWLDWDPLRLARRHAQTLASMRWIYLDAGLHDQFYLDLGAQALSDELSTLGVEHSLELFDGDHDGVDPRMPLAITQLAAALAP
jgi:enterochelin esterase-like enzyme